jgi:hypothetical protein
MPISIPAVSRLHSRETLARVMISTLSLLLVWNFDPQLSGGFWPEPLLSQILLALFIIAIILTRLYVIFKEQPRFYLSNCLLFCLQSLYDSAWLALSGLFASLSIKFVVYLKLQQLFSDGVLNFLNFLTDFFSLFTSGPHDDRDNCPANLEAWKYWWTLGIWCSFWFIFDRLLCKFLPAYDHGYGHFLQNEHLGGLQKSPMAHYWPFTGNQSNLLWAAFQEGFQELLSTRGADDPVLGGPVGGGAVSKNNAFYFIADTGDGYSSTLNVMERLLSVLITPPNLDSLSGFVVFGGDMVYPFPNGHEYAHRLRKPLHDAVEKFKRRSHTNANNKNRPGEREIPFLAIPGNHDYFDHGNSFRLFTAQDPLFCPIYLKSLLCTDSSTAPSTSFIQELNISTEVTYFLYGLDGRINGDISSTQFTDFSKHYHGTVSQQRNCFIVVVIHQPFWLVPKWRPWLDRLMTLLYSSSQLRLVLAGDLHFVHTCYIHQVLHIVCGTGGAFAHFTHPFATPWYTHDKRYPVDEGTVSQFRPQIEQRQSQQMNDAFNNNSNNNNNNNNNSVPFSAILTPEESLRFFDLDCISVETILALWTSLFCPTQPDALFLSWSRRLGDLPSIVLVLLRFFVYCIAILSSIRRFLFLIIMFNLSSDWIQGCLFFVFAFPITAALLSRLRVTALFPAVVEKFFSLLEVALKIETGCILRVELRQSAVACIFTESHSKIPSKEYRSPRQQ